MHGSEAGNRRATIRWRVHTECWQQLEGRTMEMRLQFTGNLYETLMSPWNSGWHVEETSQPYNRWEKCVPTEGECPRCNTNYEHILKGCSKAAIIWYKILLSHEFSPLFGWTGKNGYLQISQGKRILMVNLWTPPLELLVGCYGCAEMVKWWRWEQTCELRLSLPVG